MVPFLMIVFLMVPFSMASVLIVCVSIAVSMPVSSVVGVVLMQ